MKIPASILLLCSSLLCADLQDKIQRAHAEPTPSGVDTSTLSGKVMCGYQGWFNCEGDGAELGWAHWARNRWQPFGPGSVTVDLWPDLTEYTLEELYPTGFRHADGSVAKVFSSHNRETVLRHFEWMRDYGIDGAFVQRFANGLKQEGPKRNHKDAVLSHAREGASRAGRAYAVMYDLSRIRAGETRLVQEDWKRLRKVMKITDDPAYLKHEGKPVVSIWGIGFSGRRRRYTLQESSELIDFLKADGCTVMVGVPSRWREGERDAVSDPLLREILKRADIISPWTVGRYQTPDQAQRHAKQVWQPDMEWCHKREIDFLPVVYPGFSWSNLKGEKLDAIPRLKGQFLWSQFLAVKRMGCRMVYVAMFDEVDEGTAIFKCTNNPPRGEGVHFLDYEGLPSDFYLRLTGEGGRLLRGEVSPDPDTPRFNSN